MGIMDFVRFKKQEIENNISTNEIKRLKELFYASSPYDVKEITLLFQKIENKKAQKEKRTPATINKKEFKQYQQWQLKHYNAYKNQPENDYMYITPQIKKLEENLNINVYDFLKNTQPDLSFAKFNELTILRTELTKLYNIMLKYDKDQEKRTQILNKHLNNKDTKIENQDKDNVDTER